MNALDTFDASAFTQARAKAAISAANAKPGATISPSQMRKMRETAQDLEAVFLSEMLRPMFKDLDAVEPFGGGPGQQMYRDMQVDEYGKALARNGGVGLADSVLRQMIKMQESQ